MRFLAVSNWYFDSRNVSMVKSELRDTDSNNCNSCFRVFYRLSPVARINADCIALLVPLFELMTQLWQYIDWKVIDTIVITVFLGIVGLYFYHFQSAH
jgi:hypothetical protein